MHKKLIAKPITSRDRYSSDTRRLKAWVPDSLHATFAAASARVGKTVRDQISSYAAAPEVQNG